MIYNRYELLKDGNGGYDQMPFIELPVNPSDKYIEWNVNRDRFDRLANKYYKKPEFGFLITYANGKFLTEFDIPDGSVIRIPYPFQKAKEDYESLLKSIVG
jgi:adenine specific DNA methylase Mod